MILKISAVNIVTKSTFELFISFKKYFNTDYGNVSKCYTPINLHIRFILVSRDLYANTDTINLSVYFTAILFMPYLLRKKVYTNSSKLEEISFYSSSDK